MHFHQYRGWKRVRVRWYDGWTGEYLYTSTRQQGTCILCGRTKTKRL